MQILGESFNGGQGEHFHGICVTADRRWEQMRLYNWGLPKLDSIYKFRWHLILLINGWGTQQRFCRQ